MNKIFAFAAVAVVSALIGAGIALASTPWVQNISFSNPAVTDFSLWTTLAGGTEIPSPSTLDLGSPPPDPTIINYFIQNDGNVPIRVTGTVVFVSGSATVTWNPSTGYTDIPAGATRAQMSLTLTSFSVGAGSITVTFTSAQAP